VAAQTDHQRIGVLYLASVTFFFFVGRTVAMMFRIHLLARPVLVVRAYMYA
jgi:heme/copper-type cytochrome/quinol oxidase subunit 1